MRPIDRARTLNRHITRFLGAAAVFAAFAADGRAHEFFLRDGDKPVVFLGDSITEQGMYPALIEAFVLTRFPSWDVRFRNVSWSGENVWLAARSGWERGWERDVLALKPKVVVINLGMNDARGEEGNIPFYVERQTKFARELQTDGARVVLVTPSPEEHLETGQPAGSIYNRMLTKFADALRGVAGAENVAFVDQLAPFIALLERRRGADAQLGRLIPDGIHADWPGQLVSATLILQQLGAPSLVSRVEIDAVAHRCVAAENAKVELLPALADGSLAFRREDAALPWPIPPDCAPALALSGFDPVGGLSRYDLRVTGLAAPSSELTIDGVSVGTFSREALAAGVNLSSRAGPVGDQAMKVLTAVREKDALFFHRWRHVQLFGAPQWVPIVPQDEQRRGAELDRLDEMIAAKEREIDRLRQPVARTFRLRPL